MWKGLVVSFRKLVSSTIPFLQVWHLSETEKASLPASSAPSVAMAVLPVFLFGSHNPQGTPRREGLSRKS